MRSRCQSVDQSPLIYRTAVTRTSRHLALMASTNRCRLETGSAAGRHPAWSRNNTGNRIGSFGIKSAGNPSGIPREVPLTSLAGSKSSPVR